jgi:predicted dehydrogenase
MTTGVVRFGILSTAAIGMNKVTPAIQRSPLCRVVAIASRDAAAARAAADRLGIETAHGSYEALIADPNVDAIYNPLPNHLHVDWTLKANAAGKHVLCEKPLGLDVADAERLKAARPDRLIAEAFMVRYHPQWLRAREIVRSGELGTVRMIRAVFCYHNVDPNNVRNQADIGGGGMLDIGCYPVVAGRFLFEAEPSRVVSLIDRDPTFKTDRVASVIADFGAGRQLAFTVSTQGAARQSVEVIGTKGRLEIIIPFNAPAMQATALVVDTQGSLDHTLARREIIPPCDQYTEQATAFAQAILAGTPITFGLDDAILNMRVLDAVFRSEATGAWVTV